MDAAVGYGAIHNAGLLGVDLTKIDKIVISHSHFDHTEGLPPMQKRLGQR